MYLPDIEHLKIRQELSKKRRKIKKTPHQKSMQIWEEIESLKETVSEIKS